jgi:hypothetical protein
MWPLTGEQLTTINLIPNRALKATIDKFMEGIKEQLSKHCSEI